MADKDPDQMSELLSRAFVDPIVDPIQEFAESKAYTPFDKLLRDGIKSLFDEEEEEEDEVDLEIVPDKKEELVYDPQQETYFYPSERDKAQQAIQSLTAEERKNPEIRRQVLTETFEAMPEPPPIPTDRGIDFDEEAFKEEFYSERKRSPIVEFSQDVDKFFGVDLITRKDGGWGLWLSALNQDINKDLKVAVAGGARGFAALPQLVQVFHKYGIGTIEQGVRGLGAIFGLSEGVVDYDRLWYANTFWKDFSEGSEEFTKGLERLLDIKDRDMLENILLFTADLAVPLGYPGKIAKAIHTVTFASRHLENITKLHPAISPGFVAPVPSRSRIDLESEAMEPVLKEIDKFKANPSWEQAHKAHHARGDAKDRLLKQGLKELKSTEGKRLRWTKYGDKWWEWGYDIRPRTQGETLIARKRVRSREQAMKEVKPEYEDVILMNKATPEQLLFKENYNKLLYGQAIVSGGAVAGTWQTMYEGTEYENFAYAAAMVGALASPTAVMRLIELMGDTTATFFQRIPIDLTVGRRLGLRMPGVDDEFELTLPSILYLGGLLLSRTKTGLTGEDPVKMIDTSFMKRISAMSRGIPFYKVMFLDDTTKLKLRDEPTNITALDAAISAHGINLRAQEKMARWAEDNMPQEFLDSIQSLFYFGQRLENRLQELGKNDKLEQFFLTMEELVGAVQLQQRNAIVGSMFNNKAFVKNVYGFGGMKGEFQKANILTTLRVANQESTDRMDSLMKSLDELIGGDAKLEREFVEFKRGIDQFVTQSRIRVNESKAYLDELANKENIFVNLENQLELTRTLKEGFELDQMLGIADDAATKAVKKENFGGRINTRLTNFYNTQREAKDLEFIELGEVLNRDMNAGNFTDALEELRKETLEDFGNIFHILKDQARVQAYGVNRDILSGQDSIDSLISYARYNALEGKSTDALEDLLTAIAKDALDKNLDITLHSSSFLPRTGSAKRIQLDADDGLLNFDSILSKEVYDAKNNLIAGRTRLDELASATGVSKDEYLRRLLSNLSGGNDIRIDGARAYLNRKLRSKLTGSDMHTIRSSLGNWSFKKRHDPVGVRVHDIVKTMDDIFEEAGIKELSKANARYTDWRRTWHDSFLGKRMLKTDQEREAVANAPKIEELLEIFFVTRSTKDAANIFHKMFRGVDDFIEEASITNVGEAVSTGKPVKRLTRAKGSKITKATEKEEIKELMDTSLGHLLYRTNGKLNIGNLQDRLNKIDELYSNDMISEKAYKNAKEVVNLLNPLHKTHISSKFKQAEDEIKVLVANIVKETDLSLDQSLINLLDKSQDTGFELLKFLAPSGRQVATGKVASPAEEAISANVKLLRDKIKNLRRRAKEELGEEAEDITGIAAEDIEDKLKVFETVPMQRRVETRLNALLKDVFGIEDTDQFIKDVENIKKLKPKKQAAVKETIQKLESLRDVLVGSALKDARTLLKERRPELRTEAQERFNRLRGGEGGAQYSFGKARAAYGEWQEKYLRLSSDIDIRNFGNTIDDMWPVLDRLNELTGKKQFTDDLTSLFAGLVALRGEIPMADEAFTAIPRELTTSAALSRLYSGFRGVVSWRYLASEQLIREHQRRKGLILHAILTDPDFVRNLSTIIEGNKLNAKEMKNFGKKLIEIAGPKYAVYNEDTNAMDFNPSTDMVTKALRNILLGPKAIKDLDLNLKLKAKKEKEVAEEQELLQWEKDVGPHTGSGVVDYKSMSIFDDEFWTEEAKKKRAQEQQIPQNLIPLLGPRD